MGLDSMACTVISCTIIDHAELLVFHLAGVAAIGEVGLCTLDGGALSSSGMLEVLTESGWSAVSSLGFGGLEAQVVCVQLGFTFVANVSTLSVTSR